MKRIQTRISTDLAGYTENFFFGMSLKQTLLSAAGVITTALIYIFFEVPGIAAIAGGVPFFILAFARPDGMPAGQWVRHFLRAVLLRPSVRYYEASGPLYDFLWKGRLCGRKVLSDRQRRQILKGDEENSEKSKQSGRAASGRNTGDH